MTFNQSDLKAILFYQGHVVVLDTEDWLNFFKVVSVKTMRWLLDDLNENSWSNES